MKTVIRNATKQVRVAVRVVIVATLLPAVAFAQGLSNPTQGAGINSIQGLIAAFLQAVVEISLPILTLFIVYAGFQFVMARGKPEKLNKAKQNFVWVFLGAILILGAWVLATLIASTASQVLGTS